MELRKPLLDILDLLALNQAHQLTKVVELELALLDHIAVPREVSASAVMVMSMEVQARLAFVACGSIYAHVLYVSFDVVSFILGLFEQTEDFLPPE